MKELLTKYAAYNIWANNLMIDALLQLPVEAIDMPMISSFKSIRETLLHTWGAENVWLQRLNEVQEQVWIAATFKGTFEEACAAWKQDSQKLADYVAGCDDSKLSNNLHYSDIRKNSHVTPVFMVLQHVFNHATYHRGQLVTLMRTSGAIQIPGTDFIGFARL